MKIGFVVVLSYFLLFKSLYRGKKKSVNRLTKKSTLNPLPSISTSAELCCFGASDVNFSLLIRIWLCFFPVGGKSLYAHYPMSAALRFFVLRTSLYSSKLLGWVITVIYRIKN